jgi:hypothetical protein
MTMNDDTQARLLATQFQILGVRQVLVIARNDTYGQGLLTSLTSLLNQQQQSSNTSVDITATVSYLPNSINSSQDARPLVSELAAALSPGLSTTSGSFLPHLLLLPSCRDHP